MFYKQNRLIITIISLIFVGILVGVGIVWIIKSNKSNKPTTDNKEGLKL